MEEMGIEPIVTNVLPASIRQRKFKELSETTDFHGCDGSGLIC